MTTTTYISTTTGLDLSANKEKGQQFCASLTIKNHGKKKGDEPQLLSTKSDGSMPISPEGDVDSYLPKASHVKSTAEQVADPSSTTADQQLVERVQKGDKRAFDLLVLKHQHKVMHLISRYIKDSSEVQDVAQEAFIRAYKALGDFRGDSQFYTWLYRIAVNTAKNWLVAKKRRPPSQDVDSADADFMDGASGLRNIDTPEGELSTQQLDAVIQKTIAQLPDELREALTLREYEGLGYDDIAQIMDCPVGTVRSRIFRARETLEQVIAPFLQHDELK